ncbi:decapping endonuclease targeting mRNA [Tulasnella sp. 418]|nr:decapping endonuclease targeting mRNA [Tulasnella sp. 418]
MWSPSRPSGEDSSSSEEAFYALPSPQPTRPLPMQRPWCLVTFSYDSSRVLEFNNSAMKYFKQPPYGASLQRGYEDWSKRPETRPRLDGLLQAINRAEVKKFAQRADFITWRGILTKIIVFPYENRESFDLNIMIVDDVMYMEEHVTAKQLEQK